MRLLGVKISKDCPIKNNEIGALTDLFPDLNTVIVGLNREGNILTPKFDDKILENDLAYLICPSNLAERTLAIFGNQNEQARRIVLVGGGSIGREVAKLIENNTDNISLRIIELDTHIADELSEQFDKSFVILGSGMDKDILNEAEISNADILISLTNSDETNFISAAFAKSDGCERVLALLNNKDFQGLIGSVDIGDFLDPKAITVSSILRHVRRGHIRNVYTLSDGTAEVIEGEVSSSSELVGPTIEELHLANGLRIGGILRDQKIIMPRGDTKIKEGDYVTIFSIPEKIHEVEQLFRVSASYY